MPFVAAARELRQPEQLREPGLLVGWSLEQESRQPAIGFSRGDHLLSPETGYLDPILLQGEGHLMTIAPTGAGKGTGCIVPALLRYPGPVIVVDPKGENVAIAAEQRRRMGHEVVVLDPMGRTELPTATLNPLDLVDVSQSLAVDELGALAHALCGGASSDPRDRFWRLRAEQLLLACMLLVLQESQGQAHLPAVRHLLGEATAQPQALLQRMRQCPHPEVQLLSSLLANPAEQTLGSILAFAQESVDFLRGDLVKHSVGSTSFSLDAVTRGDPLSIFIVLPPHMLESHGRLLRLWLTTLMQCIMRRRRRPRHSTLFILDEAAQLGELPQLRQALTLLRGYGLQTWSFWQDASQLRQLYPLDWQTMVNNCRVLQCFGALNMAAAADMAALTGYGDGGDVLALDADEMVLQLAGDVPVVAQLPDYRKDPAFAGLFQPNPFHDGGREVLPRRSPPQRLYQRPADAANGLLLTHRAEPLRKRLLRAEKTS